MNVVVYYDDLFDNEFGEKSYGIIKAIVATAGQLLSEKGTLGTLFEIDKKHIQHIKESKWEVNEWQIFEEKCVMDCFKTKPCKECKKCEKSEKGNPKGCEIPKKCEADCTRCFGCAYSCEMTQKT